MKESVKLNLGCGNDVRIGYVNVDSNPDSNAPIIADLSILPWMWEDESVDEVLMLDFLEHFPYRKTEAILAEVWRVLKIGGTVDIQVPDFRHCSDAINQPYDSTFQCNRCGAYMNVQTECPGCGQHIEDIQDAAVHRLYGGQDYVGNWHFTTFTRDILCRFLKKSGFSDMTDLEYEHQRANWNIKIRATKVANVWGDQ